MRYSLEVAPSNYSAKSTEVSRGTYLTRTSVIQLLALLHPLQPQLIIKKKKIKKMAKYFLKLVNSTGGFGKGGHMKSNGRRKKNEDKTVTHH